MFHQALDVLSVAFVLFEVASCQLVTEGEKEKDANSSILQKIAAFEEELKAQLLKEVEAARAAMESGKAAIPNRIEECR
ncbi:phenylalanine ammonia-lyase [Canna indica]|uniref:Phenylalanine ammonia-lyase n=1 Tax=Canna indica TaxID=4628 RepID=A0AAQ3Q674_9LILI|nr:phenylalanine ammonia-lyase [Canna indica]